MTEVADWVTGKEVVEIDALDSNMETLLQTADALTLAEADAAVDALLAMAAGMIIAASGVTGVVNAGGGGGHVLLFSDIFLQGIPPIARQN